MASHAGWLYVLKTKNGFINVEGNVTKDINEARTIKCLEFGFSNPYQAYKSMGFNNDNIKLNDLEYFTLEPSYDSRLQEIEHYLMDMGYEYREATNIACNVFNTYRLGNYRNYKSYINDLIKKVSDCYKGKALEEIIVLNNQHIELHKVKRNSYEKTDYKIGHFYYQEGEIYKYSFNLKNPHIEKYFNTDINTINYYNNWQNEGLEEYLTQKLNEYINVFDVDKDLVINLIQNNNGVLEIYFNKY